MMMRRLLLVVALVALPAASAQVGISNPDDGAVTLNVHFVGSQDFPINTQPMQFGEWSGEPGTGLATHSFTCVENPPAGASPFQQWHAFYGYSSPSYVEYDFMENGRPRTAHERQLGYNATLDAGVPPILHWFLTTQTGLPPTGGVGTDVLPVPVPNVVVQATMRVGDSISPDDLGYDTGPVVAQGRSEPALLAADASEGVEHSMADGRHVYGFKVPMAIEQAAIGDTGYFLRVDVFVDNPACADPGGAGTAMPNLVANFADPDHRPSITTGVLHPLRIQSLEPRFNGTLVEVTGTIQSVWGNYDVDEGNLTLSLEGPTGSLVLMPASIVQRTHEHNHHADPVEVTWVWNRTDAPDGFYWLNLTAMNDQHTANATATAAVRLGPDEAFPAVAQDLPGEREAPVPALFVPAGAALAAALRRSRSATVKRHQVP
jgi:hypothetical protein